MKLGYSKINIIDTHNKSRSLDPFSSSSSSDLSILSFPRIRSKTHFDRIIQTNNITHQMETSTSTTKTTYEYMTSSSSSSSSSSSPSSPKKRDDDDHKAKEVEEAENVGENIIGKADHDKATSFGSSAAVLQRNCSVSSISAVKRVFSMRRSSSVSESYCRIHDQSVTLASPIDDEEEDDKMRSAKKKHRGGKILKACKRFFRLH